MKKILLILMIGIFLLTLVSATSTLGKVKQNDCIDLYQYCPSCSYVNYTAMKYPNATVITTNLAMDQSGNNYNYTFCSTSELGGYFYTVCGDKDGVETCEEIPFEVTPSGKVSSTPEAILYFILTLIMFCVCITMFYFILVIPYHNERDEDDNVIKIIKLKYIKVLLIALLYPAIIITLNIMTGLAVNFLSLTIFSGIIGFLFETMMRLAWIWTAIILFWILFLAVRDTNLRKIIKQYNL